MMYYPKAYPGVQMDGKPVPGHASVIANRPHVYFDVMRNYGWPTRYKTRDYGNPETDGHGLLMLTHWRAWVKQGKDQEWVKARWESINEAAEYIIWCLDNPELSFSEHGLLYAESEGGMQNLSIYCNVACTLGLEAYSEMAIAAGHLDKADRWLKRADRMYREYETYFRADIKPWGRVWDPGKSAGWAYGHANLAPIVIGMDRWGYDVANHLGKDWAETTRRTYKMQLSKNRPAWCAPAGLGYGQCYITQAALLLDQMSDAEKMINWMAKICFAPRLPNPYRAPEGATVATDGSVWRRWGDLGNLYQMAEVVYTIHVMLGIDDIDADALKLMPRIPLGWTGVEVKGWPVRISSDQKSVQSNISYKMTRYEKANKIYLNLRADRVLDLCRVRLGPFAPNTDSVTVTINGKSTTDKPFMVGDSKWVWASISQSNVYKISAIGSSLD
jgi:hypothetical protein